MPTPHRRAGPRLLTGALLVAVALAGCSSDDGSSTSSSSTAAPTTGASTTATTPAGPAAPIVFNGQGNNLDAYAVEPGDHGTFATQRVFETKDTDPEHGRD